MQAQAKIEHAYKKYCRGESNALSFDDWFECLTIDEYEGIIS